MEFDVSLLLIGSKEMIYVFRFVLFQLAQWTAWTVEVTESVPSVLSITLQATTVPPATVSLQLPS